MTTSLDDIKIFAKRVHDEVYKTFYDFKTTIFLCGAGVDSDKSVRKEIDEYLRDWRFYIFRYDVVYPEDLFDELLFGEKHVDLLTLENILADSVDAIVLVIESYGAVAELGAFASNALLRKKLVCVVDGKHKKAKSFIKFGPLRLIKDSGEGEIIYGDFSNSKSMIERIRKAITKVSKSSTKSSRVNNVVQAHHYILSCIYLMETVTKDLLTEMVKCTSDNDITVATAITTAALSMLRKKREIILTSHGYKLTSVGKSRFETLGRRGRMEMTYDLKVLDKLRVAVLNWQCRGKRLTS